jgi:Lar family restriction alleviation protein
MTTKLAPCPFCGSTDISSQVHEDTCGRFSHISIWCEKCESEGPPHDWEQSDKNECFKEAAKLWNKRVNYYPPGHDVEKYYKENNDNIL